MSNYIRDREKHAKYAEMVAKRALQTHDANGLSYTVGNRATRRIINRRSYTNDTTPRQMHKQGHKMY